MKRVAWLTIWVTLSINTTGCFKENPWETPDTEADTSSETTSDSDSAQGTDSATGTDTPSDSGAGGDSATITDNATASETVTSSDSSWDTETGADTATGSDGEPISETGTETETETETHADSGGDTASVTESDTTASTETACVVTNDGVERCDNIDNDCDGDIDEPEDIDLHSDPQNCGGCGNDCMSSASLWTGFREMLPSHMKDAACNDGYCEVAACDAGYTDDPGFPYRDCRFSIKQLALGDNHSCAVFFDDTVRCWGDNGSGQLGKDYNRVESSDVPLSIDGLPVGSGVVVKSLVAGVRHNCALFSDDRIFCWGSNGLGALGRADQENSYVPAPVENLDLGDGVTITTIVAGGYHNCVLLSDNTIRCWGFNDYAQLGRDTGTERSSAVPAPLDNPDFGEGVSVTALAAGALYSCALVSDNSIHCWGDNIANQLGRYTEGNTLGTSPDTNPAPVEQFFPGSGVTVRELAAASYHTCALLSDSTIQCWGNDHDGELGRVTDSIASRMHPAPVTGLNLRAGTTVKHISAGGNHTCAFLSDDTVYCWGENDLGQLGRETAGETSNPEPGMVAGIPPQSGIEITAFSAMGYDHACVLLDDVSIHCWGSNAYGQLGWAIGEEEFSVVPGIVENLF